MSYWKTCDISSDSKIKTFWKGFQTNKLRLKGSFLGQKATANFFEVSNFQGCEREKLWQVSRISILELQGEKCPALIEDFKEVIKNCLLDLIFFGRFVRAAFYVPK